MENKSIDFVKLITRKEAMQQGLKRYFTGKPCDKAGHISERHTQKANCIACMAVAFQENNKDAEFRNKRKQYDDEYRNSLLRKNWEKANEETLYFYRLFYYEFHKEEILEKQKAYHQKNRSVILEKAKVWAKNNWWRFNPHTAKRRADKLKRTPQWLTNEDRKTIKNIYKLASDKTKQTGISWHVDHIIPLRGINVSGLHVPSNLCVITAKENRSKHNKWEVV